MRYLAFRMHERRDSNRRVGPWGVLLSEEVVAEATMFQLLGDTSYRAGVEP